MMEKPDRRLLREHSLPNGLILRCYDDSRPVPGGRAQVRLLLNIEVPVDSATIPAGTEEEVRAFRQSCGGRVLFEQEHVRNFVPAEEVEKHLETMLLRLFDSGLRYLARPHFANRFIHTKFEEWKREEFLRRAMARHERDRS